MKVRLLILVSFVAIVINLNGQSVPKSFKYEKTEYGSTIITPLNEVNAISKKGQAALYALDPGNSPFRTWHQNYIVKPFQELIDNGIIPKERMKELAQGDQTTISVYFDETGAVSYVVFFIPSNKKSLLTEQELYVISKKLKTIKYDLSKVAVSESQTGSKTVFYVCDSYSIPFKDLKY